MKQNIESDHVPYTNSRAGSNRPNAETNTSGSLISFPSKIGPHTMLMTFKEYKYEFARPGEQRLLNFDVNGRPLSGAEVRRESINRSRSGGTFTGNLSGIELPIPSNLKDNDSLRVEGITQTAAEGFLGGLISGAASGLQNSDLTVSGLPQAAEDLGTRYGGVTASDAMNFASGAFGNTLKELGDTSVNNMSRDAMYLLRSTVLAAAPGISQVADRALGSAVNPKASLAFEGVELKNHSFTWNLSPKNFDESERLRGIIEKLKRNSLPTYQTIGPTSFKAYLKYPSIVDIYLLGVNPDYFVKFKSSMIRSVNVEYGSSGLVSVLKGGKPANVSLSIDLMELDIHTAEDYGAVSEEAPRTISDIITSASAG